MWEAYFESRSIRWFLTAAGFLGPWLFFFYLLGLLWLLGIATLLFAILLFEAVSSEPAA